MEAVSTVGTQLHTLIFYSKKSNFSFLEKARPAMCEGWPKLSCQEGHSTLVRRELMRDQKGSSDTLAAAVTQDCASEQLCADFLLLA